MTIGPVFFFLTLIMLVISVVVIRMLPDPERTSHTLFGEYFSVHENNLDNFSKFRVIHSAQETNGKFYEMQEWMPSSCGKGWSSSCAPPYHIHPRQNETFKILKGQAKFKVNGVESYGNVGDTVFVPAGAKHHFCRGPDSDDDLLIDFKLEPALKGEKFFYEFVGMFRDNNLKPNPMLLIWLLCEHDMYLADIPIPLHEAMCMSLRVVAPLLGYRISHDEYSIFQ